MSCSATGDHRGRRCAGAKMSSLTLTRRMEPYCPRHVIAARAACAAAAEMSQSRSTLTLDRHRETSAADAYYARLGIGFVRGFFKGLEPNLEEGGG